MVVADVRAVRDEESANAIDATARGALNGGRIAVIVGCLLIAFISLIALANAQRHRTVEKQALVDSLTGLANRRLCAAALEKELARAERFGEPLALVLATGDEVLKAVAEAFQASVREIDLAGRWGGEEFALLLPGTDLQGGHDLAERVRRKLVRKKFLSSDGERIRVTASFGVAAFPQAASQDQLVAASDGALYEAKRSGKNRVVVAAALAARSAG